MTKKIAIWGLASCLLFMNVGCASLNKKQKGGLLGAASGGALGAVIGKATGNTALGAILGAAIGGAAGVYIGSYMDKQAAEMDEDIDGATIERVGEGIKITFDSGILYDVNKASLKSASRTNLAKLATILQKYGDTNILLEGHTDASGSDEYNLALSQKRAQSVANYLSGLGVSIVRLSTKGYGEGQPIALNDTESGREQNRRVEVAIWANEKLKKAAESQSKG